MNTGKVAEDVARPVVGRLPRLRDIEEYMHGRKKSFAVEAACEEPSDEVVEMVKEGGDSAEVSETQDSISHWRDLKVSTVKISFARFVEQEREDFSDEDTESEDDDSVEFMDDGEVQRKTVRGFKLLNNCKRFWKATQLMG